MLTDKTIVWLCSGPSSSCLDDNPDSPITISNANHFKLPGQVYDGDAQCALQYGPEYKLCTKKKVKRFSRTDLKVPLIKLD